MEEKQEKRHRNAVFLAFVIAAVAVALLIVLELSFYLIGIAIEKAMTGLGD